MSRHGVNYNQRMAPKEEAHCLKLLKKEDNWQSKAKKLMAVMKEWYCANILFGRECLNAELSEFVYKKKFLSKDFLQYAVEQENQEGEAEEGNQAKQLVPTLGTIEMLIDPS